MKMFERSDFMRYKWTDEWCDTFDTKRRSDREAWCYISHRNKWRKRESERQTSWEANHVSHCNDREYAEEMTDYLIQGLDENSFDQPFLPKKPFLVARAGSMRECVMSAMYSRILIEQGRKLHHMTIKSLTSRYDKWPVDACIKYYDSGDRYVWYLYSGRMFKVSIEGMDRLIAVDEIYLSSPEFKRAYHYV